MSTDPVERYRIAVHRIGWYDGDGGRRMTTIPSPDSSTEGIRQPISEPDPDTGYNDADWEVTDTLDIPNNWPSGLYIIEFILTTGANSGQSRWYPLVVRPRNHNTADILLQVMSSTWQAYNHWGGKSLYGFNSDGDGTITDAANIVSYNRPLRNPLLPHGEDGGPMAVYYWEAPLIRYLEREGYTVGLFADQDTDTEPKALQEYDVVMTGGHDEYWSRRQRDAFEDARDSGVNLVFTGANTAYWQVRFEDGGRTLVGYKETAAEEDPVDDTSEITDRFRDLYPPRPECELLGVMYNPPIVSANADTFPPYTVTEEALNHPWMEDTGFEAGDELPHLVGYELDHIVPGCPVPGDLSVLFEYEPGTSEYLADTEYDGGAQAVTYTAPSGARVFSSGTMNFPWALDDSTPPWGPEVRADSRLERFMRNALDDMT
ncbi:N,N-dimethylformamidase beta subunit family domain-containing protein [Natronococcus wangiae]|uniref:N,N-dimethylformamidase beta subunit family domain-containing protein n=1 Tax=Natronococcus wangiae TaxID=3068275 RepID=UPI00273D91A1|nr:N,N-dimethylformamidase beta subunit family domain-containing protein [Natronococcus sp. AD5]